MLSALSFPRLTNFVTWADPIALLKTLSSGVFGSSIILPLGGNNPIGVLGQSSGALELGEQIEAGELPDCDGIYVAVGSSCTISGLIIGVALARNAGIKAFGRPGFALHLVPVHHATSMLNRVANLYKSSFSRYLPLTVRHSIHAACSELHKLGGPDVLEEALAILDHSTVVHDEAILTGKYGTHSAPSRACAKLFDETGSIKLASGKEAPGLWLCGHFAAKPMAAMCDDLLKEEHAGKNMVFWQTKSRIQPRGPKDEWAQMQNMPPLVQAWAQQGKPESTKRPGKVNLKDGAAADYRSLMTDIPETSPTD